MNLKGANDNKDSNKLVEILDKKLNYSTKTKAIIGELKENYQNLLDAENHYYNLASYLGVSFEKPEENDKIMFLNQKIVKNFSVSQNMMGKNLKVNESNSWLIDEKYDEACEILDVIPEVESEAGKLNNIVDEYKKESSKTIKIELYKKVHDIINKTRIRVLDKQISKLESEKSGWFYRLLGKEKLKDAKIENLEIKKELVKAKANSVNYNKNYKVEELLVDIFAFSKYEIDGKFTDEMVNLSEAIINAFKVKDENGDEKTLSSKDICKLIDNNRKTQDYYTTLFDETIMGDNLPEVNGKKVSNKKQIENIQERNRKLKGYIKQIEPYKESFVERASKDNAIHCYLRTLDSIEGLTDVKKKKEKQRQNVSIKEI